MLHTLPVQNSNISVSVISAFVFQTQLPQHTLLQPRHQTLTVVINSILGYIFYGILYNYFKLNSMSRLVRYLIFVFFIERLSVAGITD